MSIQILKREVFELKQKLYGNEPIQHIIEVVDPDDTSIVYERFVVPNK